MMMMMMTMMILMMISYKEREGERERGRNKHIHIPFYYIYIYRFTLFTIFNELNGFGHPLLHDQASRLSFSCAGKCLVFWPSHPGQRHP